MSLYRELSTRFLTTPELETSSRYIFALLRFASLTKTLELTTNPDTY